MSKIRQIKIQDGTTDTLLAGVNSNSEIKVHDADLLTVGVASITLQTAGNATLVDIDTAVGDVETAVTSLKTQENLSGRSVQQLLESLITEMKINNFYNSLTHNTIITSDEVED